MGAYSSTHLTPEEIQDLVAQTNFNSKEIEQLYHRFKKLDRSRSGVISRQDFQLISELSLNPMSGRILSLFQTDGGEDALSTGGVTFDCFVHTLNYFSARTPSSVKLGVLFRAFDVDGDGVLSERDLHCTLKLYAGPHLSEAACNVLVRKTMQDAILKARGTMPEVKKKKEKKKPQKRNQIEEDEDDDEEEEEEEELVGLGFEEFARVIGEDTMQLLSVQIPLREK